MIRFISLLALALTVVTYAAPADAQGRGRALGRFGAPPQELAGRVYQEPAFARGYADGFRHAQDDRRDRRGYDPVAHRDYREADQGFHRSYGPRDAYKNNYRAGFRAGYENGYRR